MKIRRKLPKPPRARGPLYVIGYSSAPPDLSDLRAWFDLEYGGPLKLKDDAWEAGTADARSSLVLAAHGPWSVAFQISLTSSEADEWSALLGWRHRGVAHVIPTTITPHHASDLVLHAARLARGLTLLTDGTAHDVTTHAYLNPSDWQDRPLDRFRVSDHITVEHAEAAVPNRDWFYTLGLAKFGLDEIETVRPLGLPSRPVQESLAGIADEIVRLGHSPKVGATVLMRGLGLSVQVLRHRTASPSGTTCTLREITWRDLTGEDLGP